MLRFAWGLTVLAALLMTTVTAGAQNVPPGRWWHNPNVVKQLNITKSEAQRLDKAFETSRIKMVELKNQVEAEQFKLEKMMKKDNAKTPAIKAQHRKLEKARSQLADERFGFVVKARNIIGQQRFQQLVNMAPRR